MSLTTHSERLRFVLEYYNYTPLKLSKTLGLKNPDRLYFILRGRNGISNKMADLLVNWKPELSKGWLLSGEGKPLNQETLYQQTIVQEASQDYEQKKESEMDLLKEVNYLTKQVKVLEQLTQLQHEKIESLTHELDSYRGVTRKKNA